MMSAAADLVCFTHGVCVPVYWELFTLCDKINKYIISDLISRQYIGLVTVQARMVRR